MREYLLSCNNDGQSSLATTDASAKTRPLRPSHCSKRLCCCCAPILAAAAFVQEALSGISNAPWPHLRPPRGMSLPPARPAAWPALFGGGRAGIPPQLQEWRPKFVGSERGGWVGQSLGCKKDGQGALAATGVPKNALTAAAKKRSHELSAACGSASWRPVSISLCGSRQCQRTLAADASLGKKPHPPAPLASAPWSPVGRSLWHNLGARKPEGEHAR